MPEVSQEVFDKLIIQMENALPQMGSSDQIVKLRLAEQNLLQPFAIARDLMTEALIDKDDRDRARLNHLFGGDCIRISRLCAICEAVEAVRDQEHADFISAKCEDEKVAHTIASDRRVAQCLSACVSVQRVLEDMGHGSQLRGALQEQKRALWEQQCGIGKPLGCGCDAEHAKKSAVDEPTDAVSVSGEPVPLAVSGVRHYQTGHIATAESKPVDTVRLDPLGAAGRGVRDGGTPAIDPLHLLEEKREKKRELEQPITGSLEAFLDERLPNLPLGVSNVERREPEVTTPDTPSVQITAREQDIDGVTWYTLKVVEGGRERLLKKRYNNFIALDEAIRTTAMTKLKVTEFPDPGVFGFRKKFDVGHFNDRRQDTLQEYLDCITSQVTSLTLDPALQDFFA